jgi:hypothetical protein
MKQNGEPSNKLTQILPFDSSKGAKNRETTSSLTSGSGKTRYPHIEDRN